MRKTNLFPLVALATLAVACTSSTEGTEGTEETGSSEQALALNPMDPGTYVYFLSSATSTKIGRAHV
jgi:hypothetical protein